MNAYYWLPRLLCAAFAYAVFKRLFGLLVSLATSRKHVRIRVDAIGFFIVRGVTVSFAQGPIARVSLREASLGRGASAAKTAARVANAVSSFRPRIPLMLRDVVVELRTPPPHPQKDKRHRPNKPSASRAKPLRWLRDLRDRSWQRDVADVKRSLESSLAAVKNDSAAQSAYAAFRRQICKVIDISRNWLPPIATVWSPLVNVVNVWDTFKIWLPIHLPLRMLGNAVLQLLLALLPSVPVRIKGINVNFEELRLDLRLDRIVLLLQSSNMFAQLHASATFTTIRASVGSSSEVTAKDRRPVLDIESFSTEAAMSVFWRAGGLRCMNFSSELGCTCVTLTPALLTAAASYPPVDRSTSLESKHRSRNHRSISERLPLLIARAPQKAELRVPLVKLDCQGFDGKGLAGPTSLYVTGEARQLRLSCAMEPRSKRHSMSGYGRRSNTRSLSGDSSNSGDSTQLVQVSGTFGGFNARLWAAGDKPSADARGGNTTFSLRLHQPCQGWLSRVPQQLTVSGDVDVGDTLAAVRPHVLWRAAVPALDWWQQHSRAVLLLRQRVEQPKAVGITPYLATSTNATSAGAESASGRPSRQGVRSTDDYDSCDSESETCDQDADTQGKTAGTAFCLPDIQLRLAGSLAAASRVDILDEDDVPIVRLCSNGASVVVAVEATPGVSPISEERPSGTGDRGFISSLRHRRNLSGIASAAATPDTLRQSREIPRTPLSAVSGWLRRSTTGLDRTVSTLFSLDQNAKTPPMLGQQTPLLSRLSVRADLGAFSLKTLRNESAICVLSPNALQSTNAIGRGHDGRVPLSTVLSGEPSASSLGVESDSESPGSNKGSTQPNDSRLQELLGVKGALLTLLPQSDADSATIDFEGKAALSGIHCSLSKNIAAEVAALVAAALPPQQLTATLRAAKRQAALVPSREAPKVRRQPTRKLKRPAARLSLVSISLVDWELGYSTESQGPSACSPAPGSATEGNKAYAFQNVFAIRSVTAELQPERNSLTLVVSDLSIAYVEAAAGSYSLDAATGLKAHAILKESRSASIQGIPLASPFAAGESLASPTPIAYRSNDEFIDSTAGRAVQLLGITTITAGMLSSESAQQTAAVSVHLDVRGVHCIFDADATFSVVILASELQGVSSKFTRLAAECAARAVAATELVADAAADLAATADEKVKEASAPNAVSAGGDRDADVDQPNGSSPSSASTIQISSAETLAALVRRLEWVPTVQLCIDIREIVVEVPIVDTVRYTIKVDHVNHQLGKLQAEVSLLSIHINDEAVARIYSLRIQLEPLQVFKHTPVPSDAKGSASPKHWGAHGVTLDRSSMIDDVIITETSGHQPAQRNSVSPQVSLTDSPGVHSAAAIAAGMAPIDMPFTDDDSELRRARQQAGFNRDDLPKHITSAAVAVCAVIDGARVELPHALEVGMAIRHTELWAKAFSQELSAHIAAQMPSRGCSKAKDSTAGVSRPAVELRIRILNSAFVMLHHPLESFLAVHGRSLRTATAEQRIWERVLDAPHSPAARNRRDIWQAAVHQSTADYKAACLKGNPRDGKLMRVAVDDVTALVLLCAGGEEGDACALSLVERLDPPSVGVPLKDAFRLQLAVTLAGAAVHFCGSTRQLAGARDVTISGAVAIARQCTAPPTTESRTFPVGFRRLVTTQVTVKGSRAPPKLYTDLDIGAVGVSGGFSVGLQPTIGLVAMAGKRLSPKDPDTSRPKVSKLLWWDEMRYAWRGRVHAVIQEIDFALGCSADPEMDEAARRLQVRMQRLDIIMTANKISLAIEDLEGTGHSAPHPAHSPSSLLALPLLRLPSLLVRINFAWHLRSGRAVLEHHIFPVPVPDALGSQQQPLNTIAEIAASSFDTKMDIELGPSQMNGSDEPDGPLIFAGDYQMRFVQELIATLKSPPLYIKRAKRFGTFFARKARSNVNTDVARLMQGFDIGLHASPLEVLHWTADVDDPSHGVALKIDDVSYDHRMRLNQPLLHNAKMMLPKSHSGMATETVAVDVRGSNLSITTPDGDLSRLQTSFTSASTRSFGPSTPNTPHSRRLPSFSGSMAGGDPCEPGDPITVISAFKVHQGGSDMSHGNEADDRTVQVTMQDCRFAFDLGSRNAVWGVVEHMAAGVAPFKKPPFKKPNRHNEDASLPRGPQRPADGQSSLRKTAAVSSVADGARNSARSNSADASSSQQHRWDAGGRGINREQHSRDKETALRDYDTGGDLMRILMQQNRSEMVAGDGDSGHGVLDRHHVISDNTLDDMADDASDIVLHAAIDADEMPSSAAASPGAAQDAASPAVRFRIQVNSLQVAAVEATGARFILAAETAHVMGVDLGDRHRVTTLAVREVQAYMSGPMKGLTPWLDRSRGTLQPASDATRMVFMPFSLQLRHAKQHGQAGQDLRIQAPEISATLTSLEFLSFVNVVRHVMMPPGPKVAKLNGEMALLGEPENETVAVAREAFALLYQEVASLSAEAHLLRQKLRSSWLSAPSTSSRRMVFSSHSFARSSSSHGRVHPAELSVLRLTEDSDEAIDFGDLQEALREHIACLPADRPIGTRNARAGRRLLLRWILEQSAGAAQALSAVQENLTEAKAAARKLTLANDAAKVNVDVDAIKWALVQDRRAFFAASLSGLKLAMTRNDDNSGFSKFIIQRIEIEEPRGAAPPLTSEPGTAGVAAPERRAIVSAWNPDKSWDDDPAVRATAVLDVPSENRLIYDNLDLLVHPMTVSFTDRQLHQLWGYFFPAVEKSEPAAKPKDELWIKSMLSRSLKRAQKEPSGGSVDAASRLSEEVLEGLSGDVTGEFTPVVDTQSVHSSSNSSQLGGSRTKWFKSKKWMLRGAFSESVATDAQPPPISSAVLTHPTVATALAASNMPPLNSNSGRSDARASAGAHDNSKGRKRAAAPTRVALFRHVRFNRVHVAITYKGRFFRLKDAKMVLDNRQYDALEGSWSDLFTKLKWDIVKSVVKSMTGLQGSKVKELLPSHLRAVSGRTERRALKKSVKTWLTSREPKASSTANRNRPQPDEGTLKELRKTQLLLGHRHVERLAARHAAAVEAIAAASAAAAEQAEELAISRASFSRAAASAASVAALIPAIGPIVLCRSSSGGSASPMHPSLLPLPSLFPQQQLMQTLSHGSAPEAQLPPGGRQPVDLLSGSPFDLPGQPPIDSSPFDLPGQPLPIDFSPFVLPGQPLPIDSSPFDLPGQPLTVDSSNRGDAVVVQHSAVSPDYHHLPLQPRSFGTARGSQSDL